MNPSVIVSPKYDHKFLKNEFSNRLKDSVNYIAEFTNQQSIKSLDVNWRVCASHYLAIKRAEKQDFDAAKQYMEYLYNNSSCILGMDINPILSSDNSFEKQMIFEILQDDPTVGIGFSDDEKINQEEYDKITQALYFIKDNNIDFYNEIIEYIDTIYMTGGFNEKNRVMRSGTNFYMWGMMFLYVDKVHTIPYYAEHIIHECAHTTLNLINGYDELVTNAPNEGFSAPFRKDLRPMIGIFHAYFVLNRVCLFFQSCLNNPNLNKDLLPEVQKRFDTAKNKLVETSQIVENNAKFTEIGKIIHNEIKKIWNI